MCDSPDFHKKRSEKTAWLRNLLSIKNRIESPDRDSSQSSLGFDLSEDFQIILEEKNILPILMDRERDNKENIFVAPKKESYYSPFKSEVNETKKLEMANNDSFLYLEKMCDKSISDPNSTIHNYIKQINKEGAKIDSTKNNVLSNFDSDEESNAINRLLNDFDIKDQSNGILKLKKCERFSLNYFNDETQLGEVEPPSNLWETTADVDRGLHVSPTKMVHLLRPSTILEESGISSNNSGLSFETAVVHQGLTSDISQYTTADEANFTKNVTTNTKNINDIDTSDTDEDLIILDDTYEDNSDVESNDNLEEDSLRVHLHSNKERSPILLDNLEDSIDDNNDDSYRINSHSKIDPLCTDIAAFNETLENDKCLILSELETSSNDFSARSSNSYLDDTLHDASNDINVSQEFDNTLDEMEYILNKGQKMFPKDQKVKIVSDVKIKLPNRNTDSPIPWLKKSLTTKCKPSPNKLNNFKTTDNNTLLKSTLTKSATMISNRNSPSYSGLCYKKPGNIKISDKILFKKPISQHTKPNTKKLFSNIISPVGAYIHRTPETPMMTKLKTTTVRSLDYAAIAAKIQYHIPSPKEKSKDMEKKVFKCPLPRKAYISAEYQSIKDERTPLNIPGGEKIHRYLAPALLPRIARHDGRMKMDLSTDADKNKTVDSSLGDLSVMSGDVSLYTIKDAQKWK